MTARTTDNEGFEHPTGVADAPTVAMYRDGLTVRGASLDAVLRAMADSHVTGLAFRVVGERTVHGWELRASFAEKRAGVPVPVSGAATCWQGHEVPLVDGAGRCHCGETIAVTREVE